MKEDIVDLHRNKFAELRRKAEKRLYVQSVDVRNLSPEDTQKLIHELRRWLPL
jgi:hypothetical protein